MSRRVELTKTALADLKKLEKAIQSRAFDAIERLAAEGHGDVKRLQGVKPPEYRLRVGDWRIRFAFDGDDDNGAVVVYRVLHRSEAY